MGYVATKANKRISYDDEENNVCVERIALHIATGVWKRAGLTESEGKDLLLFAEGNHSLSCSDKHNAETSSNHKFYDKFQ